MKSLSHLSRPALMVDGFARLLQCARRWFCGTLLKHISVDVWRGGGGAGVGCKERNSRHNYAQAISSTTRAARR